MQSNLASVGRLCCGGTEGGIVKLKKRGSNSLLFVAILAASLLAACGGGGGGAASPPPGVNLGTGSAIVQMQDAPLDNLVKFEITVVSITLNPGNVSVLASSNPVEVELTSLQLQPQLIRLAPSITAGNYTSITLQFSNPEIKFCPDPPTACTPQSIQEVNPPLQAMSVTKNVNLTVVQGTTLGLLIDFDLRASVVGGTTGPITGVNPMFTVSVVNVAAEADEFEATGRVVSVNRASATSGTFVLEVFENCQQVTLNVDSSTQFEDFSEETLADSFESLAANQMVEAEADVRSDGTLLAKKVELEDTSNAEEVEGVIVGVTRDGGGAVSSFTLVAQGVVPCSATSPTNDTLTVNISSSNLPDFKIDEDEFSVSSNLFDDPSDLSVGQKVEVDPVEALGSSITAEEIKLKDQTLRGTVDGAPTPPEFQLAPSSPLLQDVDPSITVQTSSQTEFDAVSGVSGLASGQAVRVRGLLFRNGSQLLLVAKKVDASP